MDTCWSESHAIPPKGTSPGSDSGGLNAEEADPLFAGMDLFAVNFSSELRAQFGSLPDEILNLYPHAADAEVFDARAAIERMCASAGTCELGLVYIRRDTPSFSTIFRIGRPTAERATGPDLPYVFGHLGQAEAPWTADDRSIADTMMTYWTNFAKYGDPNGRELIPWPRYSRDAVQGLKIGDKISSGTLPDVAALDLLDRYFLKSLPAGATIP